MITIVTLLAGRFYSLEAYFWGLSIIDYPKEEINLLLMTNSKDKNFIDKIEKKIGELKYKSIRFLKTEIVPPSRNAYLERGIHQKEHAITIAFLYNEIYQHIETEYFLFLEDDIIAPSNAIKGLLPCFGEKVGYVCGTQMCRHNTGLFIWDLGYKNTFPDDDKCQEKSYYGEDIKEQWGVKEIGLGHFGLTMLRKSICDKIPKPIFKPFSDYPDSGALKGCDMVLCFELDRLGYKKIANFDVRGLHMDSKSKIH